MTASIALTRFLFDQDFSTEQSDMAVIPSADAEAVRASQTAEALAEAHARGYAEGLRSGVAEAKAATEHHVARVLDTLTGMFAELGTDLRQQEEEFGRQSAGIAAAICRKFLPSRYQDTAADEIATLLATLLPRITEMPKIVVRVAGSLVDPLAQRLSDVARAGGFAGTIETIADPDVAVGNCRIEWLHGGVVRDASVLWREVDALFEDALGIFAGSLPLPSRIDNPLKRVSPDA